MQVLRFNGEPVRNLRHLAQLCLDCRAAFMRFDLDYDVRAGPPRPARRLSSAAARRPPRPVQTRAGAPRSLAGLLGSAARTWGCWNSKHEPLTLGLTLSELLTRTAAPGCRKWWCWPRRPRARRRPRSWSCTPSRRPCRATWPSYCLRRPRARSRLRTRPPPPCRRGRRPRRCRRRLRRRPARSWPCVAGLQAMGQTQGQSEGL